MAKEKDEFNFVNLPPEAQDPTISQDDFKFVQSDSKITEQKFQTKPTTFLKDCFRRFCKNKSSVVAAIILGGLLLLSIFVPIIGTVSPIHGNDNNTGIEYLEPKLFPAGTGFWDGTTKLVDIPVDTSNPDPAKWGPSTDFIEGAISHYEPGSEAYTKKATRFGKGGYVQFGYYDTFPAPSVDASGNEIHAYLTMAPRYQIKSFDFANEFKITNFSVFDKAKFEASDDKDQGYPLGYEEGKVGLFLSFDKNTVNYEFELASYATSFDIGGSQPIINVKQMFDELYNEKATELSWTDKKVENPYLTIRLQNNNREDYKKQTCTLIRSLEIDTPKDEEFSLAFKALSFNDGNQCMIRTSADKNMWECKEDISYGRTQVFLPKAVLCSFTYDTYEAALGYLDRDVAYEDIKYYVESGWLKFDPHIYKQGTKFYIDEDAFECQILDDDNCPLAVEFGPKDVVFNEKTGSMTKVHAKVFKYKETYGLKKMPIFLMGTDVNGRDMLVYVFKGLRTSLLLGIATAAVCFIFGLIWGSVSGYFGGTVDLIMERLTDILSGIPWIVVMTLTIIKLDSNFFTFALALCLTGWIGTAATTRTQFYRFRGREYVLASRTLGASHGRLIARHILPNAMGTIITSAVLMVPSVIFSEATISYLGLGFQNLASLGRILSKNQIELTNHPYLLIFPSIIIALLMISFNLFGNGLRDAVNPSLKGEGE